MKVTIWDLDYYYDNLKVNCFNPDAMKISSFHKQNGDIINFVTKKDDIYRPYDIYYLIKEKKSTPNPPFDFYTNPKVRWWGSQFKFRINWKMNDVMLACRPDYLLYPEKNTVIERSEQIRLLNDEGQKLPIKQDWHNSFKNKKVLVTDKNLWTTSPENTISALEELITIENVSFFEPIWLPRIANDSTILNLFLKLNIKKGADVDWIPIRKKDYEVCAQSWLRVKKQWPTVRIGPLEIKTDVSEHWNNREKALQDFEEYKRICLDAKERHIDIRILPISRRLDSPYFMIFETISKWTMFGWTYSWLEWLTIAYGPGLRSGYNTDFWSHPSKWNEVFRDLLRQTYEDKDFITCHQLSENDIPWSIWKKEFEYGI